jgi:hypothetical protein
VTVCLQVLQMAVTLTSGDSDCMTYNTKWTATYRCCLNAAVPVAIAYTWKEDEVVPVISTTDVSADRVVINGGFADFQ